MTNEEELKSDYVFMLEMVSIPGDSDLQRECVLSCMDRFFKIHKDAEKFKILLSIFTIKHNLEIDEA